MKVLHVVDSLGMGGAETWLMELLRYWRRQKSASPQIDFLLTGDKRGVFDDEARELGAKTFYLRYGWSCLPSFMRGFRRILRRGSYGAIHDHQGHVSGWHFLMGAGELPPVRITHVHNPAYQILNNYGVSLRRRLTGRIGKTFVSRFATYIGGTSRQAIGEYGFDEPRFQRIPKSVVHCAFDTARFVGPRSSARVSVCREFGWPEDARIVLFAGRIDQSPDEGHPQNHKNSGFAVSVGIACAQQEPRVRMLFAGPLSPAVPILEGRIAAAGLTGQIVFGGIRKDIERLMLASDALLFPSRGEGLGMVAVEAQASGLPVLASTAVPRECVVVPTLVRFRSIDAGPAVWASEILELTALTRDIEGANRQVAASAFAIEQSAAELARLYGCETRT